MSVHDSRVSAFKKDIKDKTAVEVARRHIIFGECAVLEPESYFQLRATVANQFDVHPNSVIVVGSGKLGFSLAPRKTYRPFGETSDLDVVIISEPLFESIWREVFRYEKDGGYWEKGNSFKQYLFQGWLRPDMLPPDHKFKLSKDWWEFFDRISAARTFSVSRIRGAVYKNWHFLEAYQTQAVEACLRQLAREGNKQ